MDTQTKPQPDVQALALTKAIRQQESAGNYNASGDAGTSTGAYQYQPATWKNYSQQILGDANAPMTPENQNAVTYGMVKTWKDSGLGPAEIAGKWNSGQSTGWENNVGTNNINGQDVPFNTPQYVKNVVDNFKTIYQQESQKYSVPQGTNQPQVGLAQGFIRGLASPFLRGIASVATAFDSGNQAEYNKDMSKGVSFGDYLGSYRPIGANLDTQGKPVSFGRQVADTVGTGLEAASYIVPGEKAIEAAKTALGGKFISGAIQGGKVGVQVGGIGSLGSSLQDPNSTIGSIIGDTAVGAISGGIIGAGTGGLGGVFGKTAQAADKSAIFNKLIPETEARIAKQQAWVTDAQSNLAKAYKDALPLTPSQQIKEANLLNKTGDNVYTTFAKHGIDVGTDKAPEQLQKVSDHFENAINHAQLNEHNVFNIGEVRANAFSEINQNVSSETARQVAKNKVDDEITALLKANKGSIVPQADGSIKVKSDLMERLRRTGNSWTPFNASDPEKIGKSAGWALANAVRDQVEKEGTFPAYRQANREWGKVIHAQEVLQKIEDSGKTFKVLGGLSGSIARRILSGVVGLHSGGIAGAILTEMGTEYAAKIMANPQLKTYFDRKLIERFGNTKSTPKAVADLENEIRNYIDMHYLNHKELPAPSPLGTSGNPIITPAPTTFEPQAKQVFNQSMVPPQPQRQLPVRGMTGQNVVPINGGNNYYPQASTLPVINVGTIPKKPPGKLPIIK